MLFGLRTNLSEPGCARRERFWCVLMDSSPSERPPPTPPAWRLSIRISSRTSFRTDIRCAWERAAVSSRLTGPTPLA